MKPEVQPKNEGKIEHAGDAIEDLNVKKELSEGILLQELVVDDNSNYGGYGSYGIYNSYEFLHAWFNFIYYLGFYAYLMNLSKIQGVICKKFESAIKCTCENAGPPLALVYQ